jgi:hypothetical protein
MTEQDIYARMEIDQARDILRSNAALIAKIQKAVHEHFVANGEPNERWSDYDVLDQGVVVALQGSADRVRQSLELACKAMCRDCRSDLISVKGVWHETLEGYRWPCRAAPIRKLMDGGWDE